jgi:ABC-2 type transport system ATP-binding protein
VGQLGRIEVMILAKGLTKRFDDFTAVDGVSFNVPAGAVLVLLGPNGAGKTTTVRMLTSVLRPTSGTARVAGFDVVYEADKVRSSVGVLTENHGLYGRMNATEYLQFFGQLYRMSSAAVRERTDYLLELFGLRDVSHKRLGEYSKGMRQKLALARALIHDPPVLLLDEPTSAMDPESAHMVRDAIRALRDGRRAIILCTHNLLEAEALADQIAIIRLGRIILQGAVADLKQELLGAPVYEVRLAGNLDGWSPDLPTGAQLVECGADWLHIQVDRPLETNPEILRRLLSARLQVVSYQEVARSLEQVYLQAVSQPAGGDAYAG